MSVLEACTWPLPLLDSGPSQFDSPLSCIVLCTWLYNVATKIGDQDLYIHLQPMKSTCETCISHFENLMEIKPDYAKTLNLTTCVSLLLEVMT